MQGKKLNVKKLMYVTHCLWAAIMHLRKGRHTETLIHMIVPGRRTEHWDRSRIYFLGTLKSLPENDLHVLSLDY